MFSKQINHIRNHWKTLTFLILLLITFLSLYPLSKLPDVPGTDKTHHFVAYFFLTLPVVIRSPRYTFIYLLFFIFYGGLIEIIQPYVNRYGEFLDFVANGSGVIFAYIFVNLVLYIKDRNKQR